MSILEIITYPHPTLDLQAQEVKFPLTAQDKTLISDMWQTVEDKGVGLAAPQVNVSKKICIICLDPEMIPKNQKIKNNFVMINPEVTFFSQVKSNIIEGCLSFPEQYYKIIRPSNIIVKFQNEKGKWESIKASGWLSRVIQHEVDHLNGELFINMGGEKLERENIKNKREIVD
jgi:peptide deformylase